MNKKNQKVLSSALILAIGLSAVSPAVESYAADVEAPVVENDNNNAEVQAAEQTVEELEQKVTEATEELDKAEKNLEEKKTEKQAADDRVETAIVDFNDKSAAKDEADKAVIEAEEKKSQANENYIDLLEKQADQQEANIAVEVAKAELDNAKENQKVAEEAVKEAETEVQKAQDALDTYEENLEDARQSLADFREENLIEEIAGDYGRAKLEVEDFDKLIREGIEDEYRFEEESDYFDQLEAAEAAIEEAKSNLGDKEEAYNTLLDDIDTNNKNINRLNQEITALEEEIAEEQKLLDDRAYTSTLPTAEFQRRFKELEAKKAELSNKKDQLKSENDDLNENLAKESDAYNKMQKAQEDLEQARLANTAQTTLDERANVRFDIITGKVTEENADQAIEEAKQDALDAQAALDASKADTEKIRKDLAAAVEQHQATRNVLNSRDFQERLKKAREQGGDRYDTIGAYEKMLAMLEEEEQQIAELRDQLKEAVAEENKLADQVARSNARANAIEDLRGDIDELLDDDYFAELAGDYNKYLEDLEQYQQELKDAQDTLEELSGSLAETEKRIELADEYLTYVKGKKAAADDKLTAANQKVTEAENKLKEAQNSLPAEPTAEQIAEAKQAREEAQQALDQAKEDASTAQEAYDDALTELNDALKAQKDAQAALDQAQTEKDVAEAEKDAAEKALADKEKEVLNNEAKENFEKAKQALQDRLDTAKEGADEELLDAINDIEDKLAGDNLTVPGLIDLNKDLDQALAEARDRAIKNATPEPEVDVLKDFKESAKESIAKLGQLSDIEKAGYDALIDGADNKADINQLVNDAIKLHSNRLLDQNPALKETVTTTTEAIPYETEIEPDDNLEVGKIHIARRGEDGVRTYTHTTKIVDGVPVTTTTSKVTKEAINQLIKFGTKKAEKPADPQPENPTDPVNPVDPQPENPVDPVNPVDPQPENPTDPQTPDPAETEDLALAKFKADIKDIINKLSKLTDDEKVEYGKWIDEANNNSEVQAILNQAIGINNNRIVEDTKPAPEQPVDPKPVDPTTPAVDQLDSYKDLIKGYVNKLSKLTAAERANYNGRIDAASSKERVQSIYGQAIALNNSKLAVKPTPSVDQDYLKTFRDNMNSLSKLTDAEKAAFAKRMDEAKTNGEIYDIYNEAVALNTSRSAKPSTPSIPVDENPVNPQQPVVDELDAYKELIKGYINKLTKLTPVERRAYQIRVDLAGSRESIQNIYNEAIAENNRRLGTMVVPTPDNDKPLKPVRPVEPQRPIVVPTPSRPSTGNTTVVVPTPSSTATTVSVARNLIYVPAGQPIREGFYRVDDLVQKHNDLKQSVIDNQIVVKAAKWLLEHTPSTVAPIKAKLEALIKDAEAKQARAKEVLVYFDQILGLDDNCKAL